MSKIIESKSSVHVVKQTTSGHTIRTHTEAYFKIKESTSNWPEWRITTHNENFTISANSEKIVKK